jgi:EAL and modified HD-GYP domain-containing signal transduction protein
MEKDKPENLSSEVVAAGTASAATVLHSLVRQPILNARHQLLGYQLIFMQGTGDAEGDQEASRVILDSILLHGLETLTSGAPAFLSCSAEFLAESLVSALPPESVVLEISSRLEQLPETLEACQNLKKQGYKLALGDYTWTSDPHPLLPLVQYVKVDFEDLEQNEWARLLKSIEGTQAALVAAKINSRQSFQDALAAGFSYFQGFYFCEPEPVHKSKISGNKLLHTELLRRLHEDAFDLKRIAPLVKRDTALVFRLLKLVNSPVCAISQQVSSVETAILILGETAFRRMAMLAILGEINAGQPEEVLHTALTRARFCELAAPTSNLDAEEQYLVGMLSLLPVMLQQSMADVVAGLPLRAEARSALQGEAVREGSLLAWVEAHEKNETSHSYAIADRFGLNIQKLEQFYVDAMMWESTTARSIR